MESITGLTEEWEDAAFPTPEMEFYGELEGRLEFVGDLYNDRDKSRRNGVEVLKRMGLTPIHSCLPMGVTTRLLSLPITISGKASFVSKYLMNSVECIQSYLGIDGNSERLIPSDVSDLSSDLSSVSSGSGGDLALDDFDNEHLPYDYLANGYLSASDVVCVRCHPRLQRTAVALRNAVLFYDALNGAWLPLVLKHNTLQNAIADICYSHSGHLLAVTCPQSDSILIWRMVPSLRSGSAQSSQRRGALNVTGCVRDSVHPTMGIYARQVTDPCAADRVIFSPCDTFIATWKTHGSEVTIRLTNDLSKVVYRSQWLTDGIKDVQWCNKARNLLSSGSVSSVSRTGAGEYAQRQSALELLVLTDTCSIYLLDTASRNWLSWKSPTFGVTTKEPSIGVAMTAQSLYSLPKGSALTTAAANNCFFSIQAGDELYYLPLKRMSDWRLQLSLSFKQHNVSQDQTSGDIFDAEYSVRSLSVSDCGSRIAVMYHKDYISQTSGKLVQRVPGEYVALLSFSASKGTRPLGFINCPPLAEAEDVGVPLHAAFHLRSDQSAVSSRGALRPGLLLVVAWSHGLLSQYHVASQSPTTAELKSKFAH